jgi:hypothetical protein
MEVLIITKDHTRLKPMYIVLIMLMLFYECIPELKISGLLQLC